MKEQTVFVTSQIESDEALNRLITLARKVRIGQQAIMSLSQSDDPRAREALTELARSKQLQLQPI